MYYSCNFLFLLTIYTLISDKKIMVQLPRRPITRVQYLRKHSRKQHLRNHEANQKQTKPPHNIYLLFIHLQKKKAKLALSTGNVCPCASVSFQVADAQYTGLVTTTKSDRKSELSRHFPLTAKNFKRDVGTVLNFRIAQLCIN